MVKTPWLLKTIFEWGEQQPSPFIAERDLSIKVVSKPKLGPHHSTYALNEGFWVGALKSRREGRSLGNLVSESIKRDEPPVLVRQTIIGDDAARARNDALLNGDDAGIFPLLQATARAGGDPRLMPEFTVWLGYDAPPPIPTNGFET